MKVLIVGAGVIGTVYGAHVAAAGHRVSVLRHEPRTGDVATRGLRARDVLDGERIGAETDVVPDASGQYDLVLVAVRRDQLASASADLAVLAAQPAVVFFGNNPRAWRPSPATCPAMPTWGSLESAVS
ncbi:MAG TPA: 2-dehydropantoate 2-reductase N-terminal domain-containing protein [Streptosporangiaceae bacterium]|nr:2-dehydropantoate 2-reductase N-terminal domain-containing protein [Streptosporangiaceae bacterium]